MSNKPQVDRRTACAALATAGAGFALTGQVSAAPAQKRTMPQFNNADFYKADGTFDQDRAKQAYYELAAYYGYPLNDILRAKFFVSDFNLKHFTEVGLGGVLWIADKPGRYSSIEVFLLPDQMIPEHWHVARPDDDVVAKMESWCVRYGSTYAYGEGPATEKPSVKVHPVQAKFVSVWHETAIRPGEVAGIQRPTEKHWQQAGSEGCILTEVSNYHDGAAIRFADPVVVF